MVAMILFTFFIWTIFVSMVTTCVLPDHEPGLYGTPYLNATVKNEVQCYKLCQYSKLCTSYNYITTVSQCQLLSRNSHVDSIYKPHPAGQHVKVTSPDCTPYQDANPCNSKPCDVNEFCMLYEASTKHRCIKKEIGCGNIALSEDKVVLNLPSPAPYNTVAEYGCQIGYYYISGANTSTCGADAEWTEVSLICGEVDCGDLSLPDGMNTTSLPNPVVYNSTAEYECQPGYRFINGSGKSTCQTDGVWTDIDLVCEQVDCGDLSLPDGMNMTSLPNPAVYNSTAEYECQLGYRFINGSGKSTCQADGVWTDIDLVCELIRCDAPNGTGIRGVILNDFSTNDIRYLTKAPYTCDTNYEQTGGSGFSFCQLNSTWSEIDINCTVVGCGPPPRPNNTILDPDVEESFIGTTISYSCNETRSFYISGNTNTTCLDNRRWDKLDIHCKRICADFYETEAILPASFYFPSSVGCSVEYVCATGFIHVSGANTSVCQENGEWSAVEYKCEKGCEYPPTEHPEAAGSVLDVATVDKPLVIGTEIRYTFTCIYGGSSDISVCGNEGWSEPTSPC